MRRVRVPGCCFAVFFVLLTLPAQLTAAELKITHAGLPLEAELTGEIEPGDGVRIIRELNDAKPRAEIDALTAGAPGAQFDARQWLWLDVESPGGDLDDSLEIGRFLRSANALITTRSQCTSSCIFLLAGAVERTGLVEAEGHIGIHRPYPVDARGKSDRQLARMFDDLHGKVAAYLQEMRIPALMTEMIFAVPPEQMRMLTSGELQIFLPERDPVWDESTIARRARFSGLPSSAYRRREVLAETRCRKAPAPDGAIMASAISSCGLHRTAGVAIDDLAARSLLFQGRCSAFMASHPAMTAGNAAFVPCAQELTAPPSRLEGLILPSPDQSGQSGN